MFALVAWILPSETATGMLGAGDIRATAQNQRVTSREFRQLTLATHVALLWSGLTQAPTATYGAQEAPSTSMPTAVAYGMWLRPVVAATAAAR